MLRRLAPLAADLWQHRDLLWQFTLRNVELRHKGRHLGLVWSFLSRSLMLALSVMIFGYIFSGKFGVFPNETHVDYDLGIFLGLTLFHFAAEVLATSSGLIVANPNFVKTVVFPLEILPAAHTGAAFSHLLISPILVLLCIMLWKPGVGPSPAWLPVIILPLTPFVLGFTWLFSALGVFLRDISQFTQFLTLALMFSSAAFQPASKVPERTLNSVPLAIEQAHEAALRQRPANGVQIAYLYPNGLLACHPAHATFRRIKPVFADVY